MPLVRPGMLNQPPYASTLLNHKINALRIVCDCICNRSEGLRVWREEGSVLGCHSDRWDAIWHSELGSSAALLRAGYNLDSLMIR